MAVNNTEFIHQNSSNSRRHSGGYSITNLSELLGTRPLKLEVVGERLAAGRLANGEGAALVNVGMNVIVSILGDVRHDGGTGLCPPLHLEAIQKRAGVFVIGHQVGLFPLQVFQRGCPMAVLVK